MSPLLFVLTIDGFVRHVLAHRHVQGLPLPGGGSVRISVYADDVTLFLKGNVSVSHVFDIFRRYAAISNAKLNVSKSKAMNLGSFSLSPVYNIEVCASLRILGLVFDSRGVLATNWEHVLCGIKATIESAKHFSFSFAERSYFIRSVLCARIWHLGQIFPPSPGVALRLNAALLGFFWSGRRHVLNRPTLQLPVSLGGWSIPEVGSVCKALALKVLVRVLRDPLHFAHLLAGYFCSVQVRHLPTLMARIDVRAERPLQLHASLTAFYRQVQPFLGDRDILQVPAVRISERLAHAHELARARLRGLRSPFRKGMFSGLPGSTHDFMWQAWWDALPCLERLRRWDVVDRDACCFCGQSETMDHIFYQCRLSKIFWSRVSRALSLQCPMPWPALRAQPHTPVRRLCRVATFFGFEALWHARSRAVFRRAHFFRFMALSSHFGGR